MTSSNANQSDSALSDPLYSPLSALDRADERCQRLLEAYDPDQNAEINLIDFIADAMRWCDLHRLEFSIVLYAAQGHFNAADASRARG